MDEGVAVSVRRRREKRPHLLAVEVKAHGVVVGHDRPRARGGPQREASTPARETEPVEGAHPNVVVGEDQHVASGQRLVATDVVRVHVGVDQEADLAVRHGPHGRNQPVGQWSEQGIDEQHAVRTGEQAHVAPAAGALHHVDPARRRNDRQLDADEPVGRILLSGNGNDDDAGRGQSGQDAAGFVHVIRLLLHAPKSSRNPSI